MSEFVGRTGSMRVYSYPEPRRGGGSATPFARNFATGPKIETNVAGGIQIPWGSIDVGGSTPSPDVPITPLSTGVVLISGVVTIQNLTGAPILVVLTVQLNGVDLPVPSNLEATVGAEETVVIPFLAETNPSDTPIGVTTNVQIVVDSSAGALLADSSSMNVQEVSVATG